MDIRTVYVPKAERVGRDDAVRPERFTEDKPENVDVWRIVPDMSPVADYWQAETIPHVTLIAWRGHGTFTVKRSRDGISAGIHASTWEEAVRAAYAYAAWDNPRYGL